MADEEKLERLKLDIKTWEKSFEMSRGRKPLKADLKQNPDIYKKYKKYQIYRERETKKARKKDPETPKKPRNASGATDPLDHQVQEVVAGFKGNAATRTPTKSPVTTPVKKLPISIGPTPQLDGRAMGIFDIMTPRKSVFLTRNPVNGGSRADGSPAKKAESPAEKTRALVNPQTPTKTPSSVYSHGDTPMSNSKILQTPLSAGRYLSNEASLAIPDSESPLVPRKTIRSISSILADLQNMPDIDSDEEREFKANEVVVDNDFLGETQVSDDELDGVSNPGYKKKGLKRQTKRVVMRPVDSESVPQRPTKQQDNFKRLKLHNSGFKGGRRPFKRR